MDPTIGIIIVVEGGCCREIYSLGIPLKYTLLDFDDQAEEEILEYEQQDAVIEQDPRESVIARLKEEYA